MVRLVLLLFLSFNTGGMGFGGDQTAAPQLSGTGLRFELRAESGELEVHFGESRLLTYAFASNQFKPYVRELRTLKGDNVLRDAPPDHRHHHGLMYAVWVNGINFWEERPDSGYELPVKWLGQSVGRDRQGRPQARFSQLLHWVRAADRVRPDTRAAALLIERRTISVTVDESRQEVAVRWRAEFEAGSGAAGIALSGTAYDGLGLRFPATFDHVAQRRNSEGRVYSAEGRDEVTPASWSSVTGQVGGRESTVGLFGGPTEPVKFFSMLNPFAYLSVTQGLNQAPRHYSAGEKFTVDYLLVAYPGDRSPEFLRDRYARWNER